MRKQHHTNRKQWGRRAATVAVFLALGFVVNMAVAWGSQAVYERGWFRSSAAAVSSGALKHRMVIARIDDRFVTVSWAPWLKWCDVGTIQHAGPGRVNSLGRLQDRPPLSVASSVTEIKRWWMPLTDADLRRDFPPLGVKELGTDGVTQYGVPPWPGVRNRTYFAYGLPFRANVVVKQMVSYDREQPGVGRWIYDISNPHTLVGRLEVPYASIGGDGYPFRPLWRGVIFNTAFYAALLFSIARTPLALRRRRRRRRNQCVACAYSLDGITSPACPECGQPILNTSPLKGRGREAQPSG